MPRGLPGSTVSPIHSGLDRVLPLVCGDLSPGVRWSISEKVNVVPPPPPTLMVTFLACIHAWCLDVIVGCGCSCTPAQCSGSVGTAGGLPWLQRWALHCITRRVSSVLPKMQWECRAVWKCHSRAVGLTVKAAWSPWPMGMNPDGAPGLSPGGNCLNDMASPLSCQNRADSDGPINSVPVLTCRLEKKYWLLC